MRKLLSAMLLVSLGGCMSANMDQTRSAGAYRSFTSQKPAKDVAQCIEYSWQDEVLSGAAADSHTEPAKDGSLTVMVDSKNFADVHQAGAGSTVTYFAERGIPLSQQRLAALSTCL